MNRTYDEAVTALNEEAKKLTYEQRVKLIEFVYASMFAGSLF